MSEKLPRRYYVTTTQDTGFPVSATGDVLYVSPVGPGPIDLVTAKEQATAGTTIIVLPGTYTVASDKQLLKVGVNWHFMPGAVINKTFGGTTPTYGCFDDRESGPGTFSISGNLKLIGNRVPIPASAVGLIYTENAATTLYFEADRIEVSDPTGNYDMFAIKTRNCLLSVFRVKDIVDPLGAGSECGGVYWNHGEAYYFVERNVMSGVAIHFEAALVTGTEGFYQGDYVESKNVAGIYGYTIYFAATSVNDPNYRGWIDVLEVVGAQGGVHATGQAGKFYLAAQKVGAANGNIVRITGGMNAWVQIEKMTGSTAAGIITDTLTGVLRLRCQQIEDLATMPSAANITSGTVHLNGPGDIKILNGKGIVFSGGTAFVRGFRIDTSNTNNAANRPVEISAAGLTINGCALIAPAAADSAYAGSALVLKSIGSVANRAKNANVTVNDNTVEQIAVWSGYA